MEDRRNRNGRMSVPQFGSWENQGGGGGGGGPNPADGYTMVFTKARADRKEQKANKTVPAHIAMNPDENDAQHSSKPRYNHHHHRNHHGHHQHHRNHHRQGHESLQNEAVVTGKKNILTTYLNCCCIKP